MAVNSIEDLQTRLAASEARIAELKRAWRKPKKRCRPFAPEKWTRWWFRGPDGDQIFALEGADHAYRMLVEEMQEGTVTLDQDGLILYANRQFASMMRTPVESIVGSNIHRFLAARPANHVFEHCWPKG